jgi:hypothetical protein
MDAFTTFSIDDTPVATIPSDEEKKGTFGAGAYCIIA